MRKHPVLIPLDGNMQARQTTLSAGKPPMAELFLTAFRPIG
jgi:hypothetical protein